VGTRHEYLKPDWGTAEVAVVDKLGAGWLAATIKIGDSATKDQWNS